MKSLFLSLFTLITITSFGQRNNVGNDNEATFNNLLKEVYDAYESGDDEAMWAFYTEEASEISPDGTLAQGKAALKAGWAEFMKMVDSKPTFTYNLTSWRLLDPNIALLTWNSTANIMVQGQQFGGPSSCMAIVHKIKGKWMIEFDSMTPIMQMPEGN